MRQAHLPLSIAQAVGKMGNAVLVHAHITQLPGKGEGDGSGAAIVGFEVEDDAKVGEFGRQVLVLTGQGLAGSCRCTSEGKGGAAEILAVNPATLRNRMRKLKIPFGKNANQR